MHSSRMRTARLLTITHSIWDERGVCPWGSAWGCLPGGGGGSAEGGQPRGVCIPACNGADTPHVNRITDRYKNITLPLTSFAGGNKCSNLKYHTKQLEGKKKQLTSFSVPLYDQGLTLKRKWNYQSHLLRNTERKYSLILHTVCPEYFCPNKLCRS